MKLIRLSLLVLLPLRTVGDGRVLVVAAACGSVTTGDSTAVWLICLSSVGVYKVHSATGTCMRGEGEAWNGSRSYVVPKLLRVDADSVERNHWLRRARRLLNERRL